MSGATLARNDSRMLSGRPCVSGQFDAECSIRFCLSQQGVERRFDLVGLDVFGGPVDLPVDAGEREFLRGDDARLLTELSNVVAYLCRHSREQGSADGHPRTID